MRSDTVSDIVLFPLSHTLRELPPSHKIVYLKGKKKQKYLKDMKSKVQAPPCPQPVHQLCLLKGIGISGILFNLRIKCIAIKIISIFT